MSVFAILSRNIKWRFHNRVTIVMTVLQPFLWLTLYSAVAKETMKNAGIENYTAFILPGIIVLVSFSVCSSSGIMNYMMRNDGSFYRVLTAPVSRSAIVLGQLLEAVLCVLLEVAILGGVSIFYNVRIAIGAADILTLFFLLILMVFFMAGLSCGISLLLPNEAVYEAFMNTVVLPVFFLSSALFPADNTKGILRTVIYCNPFTHAINIFRDFLLRGKTMEGRFLWVMVLFLFLGSVGYLWALYRLRTYHEFYR